MLFENRPISMHRPVRYEIYQREFEITQKKIVKNDSMRCFFVNPRINPEVKNPKKLYSHIPSVKLGLTLLKGKYYLTRVRYKYRLFCPSFPTMLGHIVIPTGE